MYTKLHNDHKSYGQYANVTFSEHNHYTNPTLYSTIPFYPSLYTFFIFHLKTEIIDSILHGKITFLDRVLYTPYEIKIFVSYTHQFLPTTQAACIER